MLSYYEESKNSKENMGGHLLFSGDAICFAYFKEKEF